MVALHRSAETYAVRMASPPDTEEIRSLYETVFDKRRGPEWFAWRYDTPYVDELQVVVAEQSGTVVGAEPFITFRFETGGDTVLAVQPADAMVHPDHRRQGLLTRMTEFALDRYTAGEPAFVFNFPNEAAVGAFQKLGWREVPDVTSVYRIQNPGGFLSIGRSQRLQRAVESGTRRVGNALYRLADRRAEGEGVTVERHDRVPSTTLARLYERDVPDALHARRDAAFFEWRLGNPEWSPTTYVASRGAERVAALVTVTEQTNGQTFTKVLEALPMGGEGVEDELQRLLAEVCRDHAESDVLKMAHRTVPRSVSRACGFLRGDRPPVSWVTSPTTMVARPLDPDGEEWTVGGRTLTESDDWELTYSEQDTAY